MLSKIVTYGPEGLVVGKANTIPAATLKLFPAAADLPAQNVVDYREMVTEDAPSAMDVMTAMSHRLEQMSTQLAQVAASNPFQDVVGDPGADVP